MRFAIHEMDWGYVVRPRGTQGVGMLLSQVVAFVIGVILMVASFGTFALPALFFGGDLEALRLGAAILLGAIGFYLLWYASRGTRSEVEFDLSQSQVREMVANRAGPPTFVGAYDFESIGGVFIEPTEADGMSSMVLRYRNTSHLLPVAEGTEDQLMPLRNRVAHDVVGKHS